MRAAESISKGKLESYALKVKGKTMNYSTDIQTIKEALTYGIGMAISEQERTRKSHSLLIQHFKNAHVALERINSWHAGTALAPLERDERKLNELDR